jgi:glycosyltransferase involved in cell wall biosynthesis
MLTSVRARSDIPHGGGKPVKVLMLSRGVVPIGARCGGAELAVYELARHLARRGHDVTLVSDVDDSVGRGIEGLASVPLDSPIQRLSRRLPGGFFAWTLQHLIANIVVTGLARRLMREQRFDHVHAYGNLSALLLTFIAKIPVTYTEEDAPPWQCRYRHRWEHLIRRAIYRAVNVNAWRRVERVGVQFPSLRDELVERWGVPAAHVFVIANGTDIELFHPEPSRRVGAAAVPARSAPVELQRVENARNAGFPRYCLFVGRLTSRKAPDLLLRALARVPDVRCMFVGDGPMRSQLEQLARALGLEQRVEFLGSMESGQLPPLYSHADLLVLPSFSETTPLVAAEAMACGTPVLATRIAGLPAMVDDFETGFLVSPGDVGELSVALRFLTQDDRLLATMGQTAQARAGKRLSWPVLAMAYEDLYRSTACDDGAEALEPLHGASAARVK